MGWRKKFTDNVGEKLWFTGYAFLIFDFIVLTAFSLWFTGNFFYRLGDWLKRVLFDSPW